MDHRECRSMAALTYVWGMADAIYNVRTGEGDSIRYTWLVEDALPFSEWFENHTEWVIGTIRAAYHEFVNRPHVSLRKEYARTTYQVG